MHNTFFCDRAGAPYYLTWQAPQGPDNYTCHRWDNEGAPAGRDPFLLPVDDIGLTLYSYISFVLDAIFFKFTSN